MKGSGNPAIVTHRSVYVHYCRTDVLEQYVIAAGGTRNCLDQAHSITDGIHCWTSVYVGESAISTKGRIAATRFRYEFGMRGYLKQAPAIESLCSLIYRHLSWGLYCRNGSTRAYLLPEHHENFVSWCNANVRVAYREFDLPVGIAKATVRKEEHELLSALRPLLNVKDATNDFLPIIRRLRGCLRGDSLGSRQPRTSEDPSFGRSVPALENNGHEISHIHTRVRLRHSQGPTES